MFDWSLSNYLEKSMRTNTTLLEWREEQDSFIIMMFAASQLDGACPIPPETRWRKLQSERQLNLGVAGGCKTLMRAEPVFIPPHHLMEVFFSKSFQKSASSFCQYSPHRTLKYFSSFFIRRFHPGRYSYFKTSSRKGTTSPSFSFGR